MLQIKRRNVVHVGHMFDFELENGELLHGSECNGEYYETENGIYDPVYKMIDEDEFEIIGFELR